MIHRTGPALQIESAPDTKLTWQQQLAGANLSPRELLGRLRLPDSLLAGALAADVQFRLRVPQAYLARMRPHDPEDPLLRQVLPMAEELETYPGYSHDPLGEGAANPCEGVIHKYRGRALLIVSGGCAVNCRYCFRRHFPYSDNQLGPQQWQQVLDYLNADPSLGEVILSGGDPLATPDTRLNGMITDLSAIPHLSRVRIHTRLPVVIPDRVTDELVAALTATRLKPVMVIHCNHGNEIDAALSTALHKLAGAGITLLNQAVLLKGINDKAEVLAALSERLFAAGVLPYYLHLLDPVAGAAHFAVSEDRARRLAGELADRLSGYLVPRLVCERPGASAKVPLLPELGHWGA